MKRQFYLGVCNPLEYGGPCVAWVVLDENDVARLRRMHALFLHVADTSESNDLQAPYELTFWDGQAYFGCVDYLDDYLSEPDEDGDEMDEDTRRELIDEFEQGGRWVELGEHVKLPDFGERMEVERLHITKEGFSWHAQWGDHEMETAELPWEVLDDDPAALAMRWKKA